VGTDQDPQGLAEQEGKLREAGAHVCPTNRLAAELARDLAGGHDARGEPVKEPPGPRRPPTPPAAGGPRPAEPTAARAADGRTPTTLLHAGTPAPWAQVSGQVRGAVVGALLYGRLAETPAEAERLAGSGGLTFDPCHHHGAVGPMAGVTTARMPVFVVEDRATG